MLKKSYDAVIFGGRLQGLLIAALLKEKNAELLILNDEDCSNHTVDKYKLDLQMMPLGGIPDSPHVTDILSSVGIRLDNRELFCPISPLLQIIDENHRLDIHGERNSLFEELRREFGNNAGKISEHIWNGETIREQTINGIISAGNIFYSKNSSSKSIKRNKEVSSMSEDLYGDYCGRPEQAFEIFEDIISLLRDFIIPFRPFHNRDLFLPLKLNSRTKYYPIGGMTGFKRFCLEKLKDNGADIHNLSSMPGLTFKRKNVTEINIEGGIKTKTLVYNSEPQTLSSLLPEKFFTRSYREQLKKIKTWGRWRSIFIAVDKDKIPVGMNDDIIVDKRPERSFMIQITPESDRDAVRDGMRLLKISSPVANNGFAGDNDFEDFSSFERSVIAGLNELIPFLDHKFEIIYRFDSNPMSSDDCIFSGQLKKPLNLGTIYPFTPYKNLFVGGKELMLLFNMEGDFISSKIIADHLLNAILKQ